jgi:hypothetical protein
MNAVMSQAGWDVRSRGAFEAGASRVGAAGTKAKVVLDKTISATHPAESVREAYSKEAARVERKLLVRECRESACPHGGE